MTKTINQLFQELDALESDYKQTSYQHEKTKDEFEKNAYKTILYDINTRIRERKRVLYN